MMTLLFSKGRYSRPDADVNANGMMDVALEREDFQRSDFVEPQEVHVVDPSQLGTDLEVDAAVTEHEARVDEVGLALDLAGTQVGDEAAAVLQVGARTAGWPGAASS